MPEPDIPNLGTSSRKRNCLLVIIARFAGLSYPRNRSQVLVHLRRGGGLATIAANIGEPEMPVLYITIVGEVSDGFTRDG